MTNLADVAPARDSMDPEPYALITGASRGIGFAMARELANDGFDLMIVGDDDTIHEAAHTLRNCGAAVVPICADLRTAEGAEIVAAAVLAADAAPVLVVLNAESGVSGAFLETSLAAELDLLNSTVISVVHLSKHALPLMVAAGHGRVFYTASLGADQPGSYKAVSAAAKAFVQRFADALRTELQDTGVSITAVVSELTEADVVRRAGDRHSPLAAVIAAGGARLAHDYRAEPGQQRL